jgi:hypothetical protein
VGHADGALSQDKQIRVTTHTSVSKAHVGEEHCGQNDMAQPSGSTLATHSQGIHVMEGFPRAVHMASCSE